VMTRIKISFRRNPDLVIGAISASLLAWTLLPATAGVQ